MRPSRPVSLVFGLLVLAGLVAPRTDASAPIAGIKAPREWRSGLTWLGPAGFDPRVLDGRIVIVEFWTFGCINCRRTTPAMRALHDRYGAEIAVVGIHTPEFDHEKDPAAVRQAIEREKILFPVAQDIAFRAWRAFDNHYWPAIYVLDRAGRIRHTHIGELHESTPRWRRLVEVIERLRAEPSGRG